MNASAAEIIDFVNNIWLAVLDRKPDLDTLNYQVHEIKNGRNPIDIFAEIYNSAEASTRRADRSTATLFVPPGHFYSPIVSVESLRKGSFTQRRDSDDLLEVPLNFEKMLSFFHELMTHKKLKFPSKPVGLFRYFSDNEMFGIGDATILSCMILHLRPHKIIEVGSGFSSAVMLDTLDSSRETTSNLTFIEPYTERLDSLLRPDDDATIIKNGVQEVGLELFESLQHNDILFLDTTHISKTDSDVNYELFQILPRLKPGVVIHFHDVFERLEYPDEWIFKMNRSWNEIYTLRAFLMYNPCFEVIYFNHAFANKFPEEIRRLCPEITNYPGGGLWLRKVA